MATLIAELRQKTRALCEDFSKKGVENFTYSSGDKVFTLQEDYPSDITSVTKNGVGLGSGEYSFDSDTNQLTIVVTLSAGDIVIAKYPYYKYSNSEVDEYIRAALVWISIYSSCGNDFEFEDDDIYPTPSSKEEDLISIIAAILIKPNYSEYRLPNLTVKYPRTMDKETKIQKIVAKFYIGLGISGIINFE